MISFFKREELKLTFSEEETQKITQKLEAGGIEYMVKSISRSNPLALSSAKAGMHSRAFQYVVYVKREDLEEAAFLIRTS